MKELNQEQKKRLKIGSMFGIGGLIGLIVTIVCFVIRASKVSQLDALVKGTYEYQTNHVALESAISTSTIFAVVFLIIAIACVAMAVFALYKAGVFNKEETK